MKLIDFDCRLISDENEADWPKRKAIALVFWSEMTKCEIDCRLKSDENEAFLAKK